MMNIIKTYPRVKHGLEVPPSRHWSASVPLDPTMVSEEDSVTELD